MDNRYFPLVVVVIMLALGLTLTVEDFKRAATLRRPLLVALVCQCLILPALCLLIAGSLLFAALAPLAIEPGLLILMAAATAAAIACGLSSSVAVQRAAGA